jgi:hypothetical protein
LLIVDECVVLIRYTAPIQSGLVFLANDLSIVESSQKFNNFTEIQWNELNNIYKNSLYLFFLKELNAFKYLFRFFVFSENSFLVKPLPFFSELQTAGCPIAYFNCDKEKHRAVVNLKFPFPVGRYILLSNHPHPFVCFALFF